MNASNLKYRIPILRSRKINLFSKIYIYTNER